MKLIAAAIVCAAAIASAQSTDAWLDWSPSRAEGIGKAAYVRGRVGGIFDGRLLKTERAYNYKLAATWMTPDVIRATARMLQLTQRITDDQARALVAEADQAGDTVVIVEIDPREGSGVIPNDWSAFLQADVPDFAEPRAVRGQDTPKLREVKALAGVLRRNYDYDRFWVVFPDNSDVQYLKPGVRTIQLVVRIHDKEGRVEWPSSLMHVR